MAQRSIVCKLDTTPGESKVLTETVSVFAAACNDILATALREKISNKFNLQKIVYYRVREKFGLSANLAVRAVARVADSLKRGKRKGRLPKQFKARSIDYDARIFAYHAKSQSVSLTVLGDRIKVPLAIGRYQRKALRGQSPTAARLVRCGREFYIHICIEEEPKTSTAPTRSIGVDRGAYNLAVTSTGHFFSGRKAMHTREKFASRRAKLQAKGTRSAKRVLQRLSGKEHRWMRDTNHRISKAIVAEAIRRRASIKLEALDGIRDRINTYRKLWRTRLNTWAFGELEAFTRYKALLAGVRVESVAAYGTSRECCRCHAQEKKFRRGAHFVCAACGYRLPADLNAAKTISGRPACPETGTVTNPMVASESHRAPQQQAAGL
jgi:IS605 OrfB family transposase